MAPRDRWNRKSQRRGPRGAIDSAGNALVVGTVQNVATNGDFTVVKLSAATGAELWRRQLIGREGDEAFDEGVAVDAAGNVAASGQTDNQGYDFSVAKLSGTDGSDLLDGTKLLVAETAGKPASRQLTVQTRIGVGIGPGSASDPTLNGALLEIRNPMTAEADALELPAGNWSGLGNPPGSKGFKYVDRALASGPCNSALIKPNRVLQATCKGSQIAFSLDESTQGSLAVRLTTGTDNESRRYCMLFGGTVVADVGGAAGRSVFSAKDAPTPATCPFP